MLGSGTAIKMKWTFYWFALVVAFMCTPAARGQSSPVDCSSYVTVTTANERSVLDPRTRKITSTANVTITNMPSSGKILSSPLQAVVSINNANGTVTMPEATGQIGGKYYYDLSSRLTNGQLPPGAAVTFTIKFVRASTVRFTYTIATYAVLPPAGQSPIANAGSNQTLTLPAGQTTMSVELDGSASYDPDGSISAYSWSGTPDPGDVVKPTVILSEGTYSFTLIVTDNSGATSQSSSVSITINPAPNQSPVANAGPTQILSIPPGEPTVSVQLNGSGSSDSDGTIAAYVWSGTPNPADVVKPVMALAAGTYEFVLVVTDDKGASSAPANVTITITAANPPELSINPLAFSVNQGATLSFTASAVSPDGRGVTLAASPALGNATFEATSGAEAEGSFVFSPDAGQVGKYLVNFKARDTLGLIDSKTVQITVNKVNHPPVLTIPPTVSVREGEALAIPVSASDPDGDILSFTTSVLPANTIFIPSTGTIAMTPDYTQSGSYSVTVSADDGTASASGTVQITVTDVPTGSEPGASGLTLQVDPVESPTFNTTQRITGTVNGAAGQPAAPMAKSALITGMSPATGEQGDTLEVVLTGDSGNYATHFSSGVSKADFGQGITVNSLTINSPSSAVANVTVGSDAAAGTRSVNIITGSETALSILAFNVLKGTTKLSGRILDKETGQAVAGAQVTIQGTNLSAITDVNGYFTLVGAPTGAQTLLVNPPDHELITLPLSAQMGVDQDLGEMKTAPTVFNPDSPAGVSMGSLLSRTFIDSRDKRTIEDMKQTVIDAIQFVGGRDLGIADEYGNELNPNVTDTPFFRLSNTGVETIAMHMKGDTSVTLAELLWQMTQLWHWGPADSEEQRKPNLLEWLKGIQTAVNAAWANPSAPESRFFILLFNGGRTMSAQPPTIVPDLPLNELQASLIRLSLLITCSRAIDKPSEVFEQLPEEYYAFVPNEIQPASPLFQPVLLAFNGESALGNIGSGLLGDMPKSFTEDGGNRLFIGARSFVPPDPQVAFLTQGGGGGQQIIAKAARPKENGYLGKQIVLDARQSVIPSGMNVIYDWSVLQSPGGSSCGKICFSSSPGTGTPSLDDIRRKVTYFTPDKAGIYKIQLLISSLDGSVTSDPFEVSIAVRHWPCQIGSTSDPEWELEDKAGLEVPWLDVFCSVAKESSVTLSKAVLTGIGIEVPELPESGFEKMMPKGLFGGTPNARAASDNLFMSILETQGLHPQTIASNAKAYEAYLPKIMNEAQKNLNPPAYKKIASAVSKELVTGVLGYFQSQADALGEAIIYLMLDKTIEMVIDGMRPAPPLINSVNVIDATFDPNKKIALIYFLRSPNDPGPKGKDSYCKNPTGSEIFDCNADFYYRLWRESSGEIVSLALAPESKDDVSGPVPTDFRANGEPLLFIDYNPPEGHVRYFVQARRLKGKHEVPNTNTWNEVEFFLTNVVVGSVCPPAAAQYSFAKGMIERAVDMLRQMKIQNSDFSDPATVYVPKVTSFPSPPVSLASNAFQDKVYASIALTSSVFTLNGNDLEFAFNAGFKEPYQVGLAVDASGLIYSVNSASEERFGGRLFRWDPVNYNREWFGAVKYYSTLLGYAHPSATQALYAGMNWGQEKLFIIDLYGNEILSINIPPNGAVPPGDLFHNVGQPVVKFPDVMPNPQSSMTIRLGGDLLMTQGSNIFRYTGPGDFGLLMNPSPFVNTTGIDADLAGNLYVVDSTLQTIMAIPSSYVDNSAFHNKLVTDPATKSLYSIFGNVINPGELRVGGKGTSLVWFDQAGYRSRQFGLSARVVDSVTGQPISFATVSHTLDPTLSTMTDQYGVFHMPGLISTLSAPRAVSLVITDTLKRTSTLRIPSLEPIGETFVDPLVFTPDVIPLPESHVPNPPPGPPVEKNVPATVTGGVLSVIITEDLMTGGLAPVAPPVIPPIIPPSDPASLRASKVELIAPVNGLQVNTDTTLVSGVVSDPTVETVEVLVNGTVVPMPVLGNRRFSGIVNLKDGINSIEAKGTITNGQITLTGSSGVFYVQRIDGLPAKGALSGMVLDSATGYPVADVRVIIKNTGLYTYTDSLGVWFISDLPAGNYEVQIIP